MYVDCLITVGIAHIELQRRAIDCSSLWYRAKIEGKDALVLFARAQNLLRTEILTHLRI